MLTLLNLQGLGHTDVFLEQTADQYYVKALRCQNGSMPRRLIARLFLFVWLALLGIEFIEQIGWFRVL